MIQLELATLEQIESSLPDPADWLTDEESARVLRMGSIRRRRQFLAGHWLARTLASGLAGGSARDWRFLTGDGVRRIAVTGGSALFVSISHCADQLACAISSTPVGVDIELERKPRDHLALARQIMSHGEYEAFAREPEERQVPLFLRRWTLAEARGKLSGAGLQPSRSRLWRAQPCTSEEAEAWVWSLGSGSLALCSASSQLPGLGVGLRSALPSHWRFVEEAQGS
jgi:4'-phosphopantetheinyl transferase